MTVSGTMLAARFVGEAKTIVDEVAIPDPKVGELLVRVDSCALCGTDRTAWINGADVTPGHEISGTAVSAGPGVVEAGLEARGVVYLVDACGECSMCRRGSQNACRRKRASYGFTAPGGFAEYVAVRAGCFLPIGASIPLDAATALLDLFGTSHHAFVRAARPEAGSVAVVGCGPIGLGAIAVAAWLGIPTVMGIDRSAYRLALAERLGAVPADTRSQDVLDIGRSVSPDGFDIVIEAAGTASTQRIAIELCAPSGAVVIVAHSEEPLAIRPSSDLIAVERALVGSEYFPPSEFPTIHGAVRSGRLDPGPLITHRFPLGAIAEACETFFAGDTGKVLVRP